MQEIVGPLILALALAVALLMAVEPSVALPGATVVGHSTPFLRPRVPVFMSRPST